MKLPVQLDFRDATGKFFQYDKLEEFIEFIKDEQSFWVEKAIELEQDKAVTSPYLNNESLFQAILDIVKTWKKEYRNWEESEFFTRIQYLDATYLSTINAHWIWSAQPFVPAWLNSCKISSGTGEGFLQLTLTKSIPNLGSYDWFRGYLLAYEFELQDESLITTRRNAEANSFEHLRSLLAVQKDELVGEISGFKVDAENIKKTYVEFMRLKGPAEYWKIRAATCRDQGKNWAGLLGATIIVAGFIFVSLMDSWLHAYKTGLELNTLEGAVIFAAILSVFAFAIRTLSKLTFSAFHLQRDAEEREQLTHLYLALSNDNKVDAESRNIVLQALFSRSDSGLLAGDHSPTMPSIQEAIRAAGRQN